MSHLPLGYSVFGSPKEDKSKSHKKGGRTRRRREHPSKADTFLNSMGSFDDAQDADDLANFEPVKPAELTRGAMGGSKQRDVKGKSETAARQPARDEPVTPQAFGKLAGDEYAKQYARAYDAPYYNPYVQTYTGTPQHVPYYSQLGEGGQPHHASKPRQPELLRKLNYMIHLLEEQKDEKTEGVTEELVLYMFLGVFVIFVVDSFARAAKYTR